MCVHHQLCAHALCKAHAHGEGLMPHCVSSIVHGSLLQPHTVALHRRECDARPLIISYGHHPLGTVAQFDRLGLVGALRARNAAPSMHSVLIQNDVAVYLNGHLHGLFGPRLHRLLPTRSGGV